ncbi:MAG: hypothetical protein ACJ786_05170 [Catenulispora sp.]
MLVGGRIGGAASWHGEQAGCFFGNESGADQALEFVAQALDVRGLGAEVQVAAQVSGAAWGVSTGQGCEDVLVEGVVGQAGVSGRRFILAEGEDDLAGGGQVCGFGVQVAQPVGEVLDLCAQVVGGGGDYLLAGGDLLRRRWPSLPSMWSAPVVCASLG